MCFSFPGSPKKGEVAWKGVPPKGQTEGDPLGRGWGGAGNQAWVIRNLMILKLVFTGLRSEDWGGGGSWRSGAPVDRFPFLERTSEPYMSFPVSSASPPPFGLLLLLGPPDLYEAV